MKDFDIAKYLREHQLGSYGILNHYVDLKPLKEEETEEELATEVPYAGPDQKLTGNGEGDEFEQAQTVSEMQDSESGFYDMIWDLAGDKIKSVIDTLRGEGFQDEDIKNAFMTAVDQYDQVFPPMEEEWDPSRDQISKKFIGRLPKSVQAKSSVDKVLAALKTAGISTQDLIAFVDAVKTDPDALAFE